MLWASLQADTGGKSKQGSLSPLLSHPPGEYLLTKPSWKHFLCSSGPCVEGQTLTVPKYKCVQIRCMLPPKSARLRGGVAQGGAVGRWLSWSKGTEVKSTSSVTIKACQTKDYPRVGKKDAFAVNHHSLRENLLQAWRAAFPNLHEPCGP